MKKTLTCVLATAVLVVAGCTSMQPAPKTASQKAAIESVLAQRAELRAKEGQVGLLKAQNVAELMAIDVKSCPADFRSAWFDYLVEVENLRTRVERVAAVAAGVGKPVQDLPSLIRVAATNSGLSQYLLDALTQVDNTWSKLNRTAMNYGVMPTR